MAPGLTSFGLQSDKRFAGNIGDFSGRKQEPRKLWGLREKDIQQPVSR